ncbi:MULTISPECIES: hypothetical protein [Bacillaceae]|uniref:hypothetical protein n=1 Tax=Bacillaceae TaxID=186817 RepID=UPI001A8D3DDA|nr:hypothetical protein [Bacillus sp. NTK034]MBN8202248.1 hypothetical protein [Bacillus sp. NTK034]
MLDAAAHIWYGSAISGDIDAINMADGIIKIKNNTIINQNNTITGSSAAYSFHKKKQLAEPAAFVSIAVQYRC